MKSKKTASGKVTPQKTLSTESSSRLSKRTKRYIREEVKKEVAKQLLSMQRPETPTPLTNKEIQKVYSQARRQYPKRQGALMIEWYDRFLPIFRMLVSNREVSVDQLRNRTDLNAEAVQRLHLLDPTLEIKKLKRFALCKSEEAQARFLARAAVGNVFWLSLSHSESLMRNLLAKRNKV
ncbi:MAG: hypothetical protein IH846_16285 [Acidobacteria bacterium]|nr:hypothetical protein [Acidobacteriota bacterium]